MSGIELVGLAASVLQIADLGWKVSYKLYAFSKKVHEAGKTIELISQDISATGAILKQLGDAVKEDEKANPASRLCSQGLIDAAGKLVEECQELFKEIDIGIGGRDGHKVILGFKQKLKWSYLEPRVELLRKNLERLKSSLAIMLNVLIYAEQLRGRENKTILSEQQTLVASFATQKAETEKRIEHLKRAIEYQPASEAPSDPENANLEASTFLSADENEKLPPHVNATRDLPVTAGNQPPPYLFQMNAVTTAIATVSARTPQHQSGDIPQSAHVAPAEASKPSSVLPHLEHHRKLIEKLLEEVNSSRYAIDHGVRYRLHDGVLDLHWQEWSPLRQTHGDDVLRRLLAQSPVLARHWHKQVSSSESDASVRGKSFSAAAKESLSTSGRRDSFPSIEDLEPKAHAAPDPADGELLERQAVAVGNFTNTKDSEPKLGTERAEKADLVGTQLIAYEPSTHQDLSIEATDEEDIDSLYEEIKTIKQNDVLSTRNTLRGATQAEESGQDTLARLGVQSENLPTRYRNLDLSTTDSMVGTDRHKFSRSMFAVHSVNPLKAPQDSYVEGPSSSQTAQPSTSLSYDNPVTSPKDIVGGALGAASAAGTSRAQMGDRERRRSRRGSSRSRQSSKSSVSSRERGRAAEGDALDHQILPEAGPVGKAQRLGARKVFPNNFSAAGGNTALILEDRPGPSELTHVHPGAPHPSTKKMLAERSKYQFEADTDDDEVGDEIDLAKGAGSTAIDWGKLLARATGDEVGAEHHRTINRVGSKACSPSNAFFLY